MNRNRSSRRAAPLTLLTMMAVVPAVLAACGDPSNPTRPGLATGIAIVSSDYKTATVISLVDPSSPTEPRVAVERCFDSNSTPAGTSAALSGDVVLPSAAQPGHELVVIDRANSSLTWLDPGTCSVLRQMSTGKTFAANPQDVIAVSATKAYVPRYGRNAAPTADASDFDDGDDLLIIDPQAGRAIGTIDVSAYKATVDGNTSIEARPTRGVVIGDRVFVALDSLASDYSAQGEGRLVVVNPEDDSVDSVVSLTGLKNCSSPMPSSDGKSLLIPCAGAYSDADQTSGSGLAVVDVSSTAPTLVRTVRASTFGGRSLSVAFAAVSGMTQAYVATMGAMAFGGSAAVPDELWSCDFGAGTAASVLRAEANSLGASVFDPVSKRVFVSVAEQAAPRLAIVGEDGRSSSLQPTAALPPRAAAWY